ncbi:prevent-host-death protein [Photobacterium sp. GB-36]|uniref:prevent-host-death protein n=1 Tax=Photobacterium sp. GB-36 TaxID=2022108 RepID=UPI000D1675DF|nr:prevent-host-death protein [Photobacterium sp. GB-36]PSV43705.1 prevent-host-death protein [Photobacterium sp. GB-36]
MIETVNFLKKNADHLSLDETLIITKNEKHSYAVIYYGEYERREQAIAIMKMLSFAESDIKKGRISSMPPLKERLVKREIG